MKKLMLSILSLTAISLMAFTPIKGKLVSSKTHIKFFSSTALEDIEANNYKAVSTLDTETGDVVFSVPMQSFEFDKALMQEHYNGKNFLSTKKFPKSKMTGKITNLSDIDFTKNGQYNATVKGEMTIKGEMQSFNAKGSVSVADGKITINSKFNLTLADYKIAFKKGKPSTNIAKTIEITLVAEYSAQ
jgi:polyisoprenoid-binding protein YceI